MTIRMAALGSALLISLACAVPTSRAQSLYKQNFDIDDSANWTVFDGPTDETAEFFYDYSALGIPAAPRSTGTTRGMRLRANLTSGIFGGFSASPNAQSFSGNYTLKFDWWGNYIGPLNTGATGSSMLSTFGILTSGNAGNYAGASDSVFFAATSDGGSGADYRAYSSERNVSYQVPPTVAEDAHAVHEAGSRDSANPYYMTNFPGGFAAPALQQTNFPDDQTGTTPAGTMGFTWHQVDIQKDGTTVRWFVDGVLLITVETAEFTIPTGGTNILFGHADINGSTGTSPNYAELTFTLIDNVRVINDDAIPGDANLDNKVDVADLGILATNWQLAGEWEQGDFDGGGTVEVADLGLLATNWQVGVSGPSLAEALESFGLPDVSIPEPQLLAILVIAPAFCSRRRRWA